MTEKYLFITFVGGNRGQVTKAVPKEHLHSIAVSRDSDIVTYNKTHGNIIVGGFDALDTEMEWNRDYSSGKRIVQEPIE